MMGASFLPPVRFIAYIKDELLIVLGTSSSETVLPQMMQKIEHLGASRSVVGLSFPPATASISTEPTST
jgi:Na+/H+-dicarboxylate symporter